MSRLREPPAGCVLYFMLSILINLFIVMLRISALEVNNNSTVATAVATPYILPTADAIGVMSSTESTQITTEFGKCYFSPKKPEKHIVLSFQYNFWLQICVIFVIFSFLHSKNGQTIFKLKNGQS